jgi:serine O-acetyltransferase
MLRNGDEMELQAYVTRQLDNLLPPSGDSVPVHAESICVALNRARRCISRIKASRDEGFNPLISGHYATFLYFLSHDLWRTFSDVEGATRVFLLNKALNGIDLFYEVEMPDYFLIGHTVCMVFAKARYEDYCVFHQGCTVGRNGEDRPILEKGVILYPHSSVIGRCHVRENTVISPGVHLVNADTPGSCIVFPGESGRPTFKAIDEFYADRYFTRD